MNVVRLTFVSRTGSCPRRLCIACACTGPGPCVHRYLGIQTGRKYDRVEGVARPPTKPEELRLSSSLPLRKGLGLIAQAFSPTQSSTFGFVYHEALSSRPDAQSSAGAPEGGRGIVWDTASSVQRTVGR